MACGSLRDDYVLAFMRNSVDWSMPNFFRFLKQRMAVLGAIPLIFAAIQVSLAEPVSVNRGAGQGLVVSHRGNCYLLIPDHVRGRSPRLSISAGAPPVVGEATVFHSFVPGADLAVAHVRGNLQGRCNDAYADLPQSVDRLLDRTGKASLVRVQTSGQITRTTVSIVEILYDTLRVKVDEGQDGLYQGTSGSFLFVDGLPVGMMIEAPDQTNGIALRADSIADRTRRLLEGRLAAADTDEHLRPAGQPSRLPDAGLSMTDIVCSAEPTTPDAGCSNLLTGTSPLLVSAPGKPVTIEIELGRVDGKAAVVRSVEMSTVADDHAGPPKSIQIDVDSSQGAQRRWRSLGSGDMSPFGELFVSSGAGQFARRLRVTILTSWRPELPVRLDRIVVR